MALTTTSAPYPLPRWALRRGGLRIAPATMFPVVVSHDDSIFFSRNLALRRREK